MEIARQRRISERTVEGHPRPHAHPAVPPVACPRGRTGDPQSLSGREVTLAGRPAPRVDQQEDQQRPH
ncbi:hypothetical protein FKR81_42240 [Lentzea tibetensis]|uniref:Uncharacterized protein n=1 Tax=Lentzea tibetensis TaxID=2591470 RepID=A0A563EEQ5_9PSEU|nr:hypothetical protein FKR81_42240 [Lentzea tibetensis]